MADETAELDLVYPQLLEGSGQKLFCRYDDRSDVDDGERIPEKRGRRKRRRNEKRIPGASTLPPGAVVPLVSSSAPPPPPSAYPPPVPGDFAGPGGSPPPLLPLPLGRTSPGAPPPPPPPGKVGPPPPPPPGGGGPLREGQVPPPARLKPLHWDKMQTGNASHPIVWDLIPEGSFQLDEEDLEAYFGKDRGNRKPGLLAKPAAPVQIVLLDNKQSQNIAIILRSLAVARSTIVAALLNGHDLSTDTLEKLSNISLSEDEEALVRGFSEDPAKLAEAESFLFHLFRDVPGNPFARVDALLLRSTFSQELSHALDSLSTLKAACLELKPDRGRKRLEPGAPAGGRTIFAKLLEAVLKAGNKMNQGTARGNAKAFNLSSLRKLSDVKSTDGNTTLLHFLVKQVVCAEGRRAALNREDDAGASATADDTSKAESDREHMMLGLPVVGELSAELANVKKAAMVDHDLLMASLSGLEGRVRKIRGFVSGCGDDGGDFAREMQAFLDDAEGKVKKAVEEKERAMELVRRTTDFYQPGASKGKNVPPLQLFVIVKDFLGMVDQACVGIARNLQEEQMAEKLAAGESPSVRSHERWTSDSGTKEEDDEELRLESGRISMPRFLNLSTDYLGSLSGNVPWDWDDDDAEQRFAFACGGVETCE